MALKVALCCLLIINVITTSLLVWHICNVREEVETMRTTYKDILQEEVKQVNTCFDEWGKALASLDRTVELNVEILDVLRGVKHDEQTD